MTRPISRSIHDYDDMIDLPRPISHYPRMSASARAAQFAPYAALVGYKDIVAADETTARTKTDLDHDITIEYDPEISESSEMPEDESEILEYGSETF